MNKKGALTDMFLWLIVSFSIAVVTVMLVYTVTTAYEGFREKADVIQEAIGTGENATKIIDDTLGAVVNAYEPLKWITTMLIIGMALSILIFSYKVRTSPVFFVAYLLITVIAIIVSVPLSNVYEKIYLNPTLASTFAGFWGQNWIFLHLPMWTTIIGILGGIILFINISKGENTGGNYGIG